MKRADIALIVGLPDSAVDRTWKRYRFERVWMPLGIRVYFLNQSGPDEPTRMLNIKEGIVKLYGFNIFDQRLVTKDILNVDSEYCGLDGKKLFAVESAPGDDQGRHYRLTRLLRTNPIKKQALADVWNCRNSFEEH